MQSCGKKAYRSYITYSNLKKKFTAELKTLGVYWNNITSYITRTDYVMKSQI